MNIILSNPLLDLIDTRSVQNIPEFHKEYFHYLSGTEHYRLMIHLSYCWDDIIISDIGTFKGTSALALAQNKKNTVLSFDIQDYRENDIGVSNVAFRFVDFLVDLPARQHILLSKLISLDLDHNYATEKRAYDFLKENKWKGVLICDDIHLNDDMKRFWNEVDTPKIDITAYGHNAGTGAILFGDDVSFTCL